MNRPERDVDFSKLSPAATAVSAAGLGLVTKGAMEIDTLKGVAEVAAGRACDGIDGSIARALGQESDAGAIVDAGFDKLEIAIVSAVAWKKEAIPKPAIATIFTKNALSAGLTYIAGKQHPHDSFRPTKWGKISMGADSIAYAAYLTANALENERPELINERNTAIWIGRTALAATVVTGAVSLVQYTKRIFDK